MDPLCGVTRGMRLALLGHLGQAWRYNPLSVVLVGGAIAAVLRQVLGVATGRWLNLSIVRRRAVLVIAVLLTVALEINQQAHAALLRTTGVRLPFAGVMLINERFGRRDHLKVSWQRPAAPTARIGEAD